MEDILINLKQAAELQKKAAKNWRKQNISMTGHSLLLAGDIANNPNRNALSIQMNTENVDFLAAIANIDFAAIVKMLEEK